MYLMFGREAVMAKRFRNLICESLDIETQLSVLGVASRLRLAVFLCSCLVVTGDVLACLDVSGLPAGRSDL